MASFSIALHASLSCFQHPHHGLKPFYGRRRLPYRNFLPDVPLNLERKLPISKFSPDVLHGFGLRLPGCRKNSFAFAASHEESASFGSETSKTKLETSREELEQQAQDSKKTLNQAVDNIKDEALKMEDAAESSDAESVDKIIGILRDTTEQLKEHAEKAKAVLAVTAEETAVRSKENLIYLAEKGPEPIRDIADTALKAHFPENARNGARIHDFCLGIPYGSLLAVGGLIWFILSGSTAAIRFGVILGGAILALSMSSLKVWKQGKSSMPYIKGQAAIALILLFRELRKFLEERSFFPYGIAATASAGMLGFYLYVYMSGGNPPKKRKTAATA